MEKKFYDFCIERGYIGHIYILTNGSMEFTIRCGGYGCSLCLTYEELHSNVSTEVLVEHVLEELRHMIGRRKES